MRSLNAALLIVGIGLVGAVVLSLLDDASYKVQVRLAADNVFTSRNLGTMFEAVGGNTICRAGFPAGAQTRGKIAQKHLEFTCGPRDAVGLPVDVLDFGRPSVTGFRPEVRSYRDQVVDVASGAILHGGNWLPFDFNEVRSAIKQSTVYVQSVQRILGKNLAFPHSVGAVVYGESKILSYPGSFRNGIYYDGVVYVAHFDSSTMEGGITYCRWTGTDDACVDPRELPWPFWRDIYGMLGWKGNLFMSTGADRDGNGAGIWKIEPQQGLLTRVFPSEGEIDGEFYGMTIVGDTLVAGHYPSGYLAVINPDGTSRFVEEPAPLADTYGTAEGQRLYREAQSLNLYAGRLWVGMYPWGFLWEGAPSLDRWERHRLFSWPDVKPDEVAPFHRELRERYLALSAEERASDRKFTQPSFWGQRIHSAALSGEENAVLYGLGNMPGLPYDADRDSEFGSVLDFHEYGSVRGIRAPNTIVKYIPWTDDGILNLAFIVKPDGMVLMHEGRVVETIEAELDPSDLEEMKIVSAGSGLYGVSEYRLEASD